MHVQNIFNLSLPHPTFDVVKNHLRHQNVSVGITVSVGNGLIV